MPDDKIGRMECDFCHKPLKNDYVTIQIRKRDFDNRHRIMGTYSQYKIHTQCWSNIEPIITTKFGVTKKAEPQGL